MRGRYERDQVDPQDAQPLRNMTITSIALAEDLRTSVAFGEPDVAKKWKRFMSFFSMLYGITKHFIREDRRKEVEAFMGEWFRYGYLVKRYKNLKAISERDDEKNNEKLRENTEKLRKMIQKVNPARSLELFEKYIVVLKKRGMYVLAETTIGEEGFEEEEDD